MNGRVYSPVNHTVFNVNPAAPQRSTEFFAALVAKLRREDISDLLMHYPNEFAKLKELVNARNK